MEDRLKWIDIAKGIGIILVVLGHTGISSTLLGVFSWIYSFHMPLFYFISGVVFNRGKYHPRIKNFFLRRWKNLVIPFITLNLIVFSIANLFCIPSISKPIITELFTGTLALYFIRVLFITEIWYLLISKVCNSNIAIGTSVLVVVLLSLLIKSNLGITWNLNAEICNITMLLPSWPLIYYALGNLLGFRLRFIFRNAVMSYIILVAVISLILSIILVSIGHTNCIYYSLAGIVFICNLSVILEKTRPKCHALKKIIDFISFIGRNTLIIVALHQVIYNGFKYVTSMLVFPVEVIIRMILTWMFLVILIKLINRYVPFLVGK